MAAAAYAAGIFAGTVVVPLLLPWIPGRAFSFKGVITGLLAGAGIVAAFWGKIETLEALALLICTLQERRHLPHLPELRRRCEQPYRCKSQHC
jgi:hypothetical protein